ncbi:MAG: DUF2285 domain-containing protein [Sphingomonadales bacterium]|nr:DUF2285 domain-containing protein [Sphingomonadales bacterium]
MVVLETSDIATIPLPNGYEPLAERISASEHHMIVATGVARLRLCLRLAPPRRPDCLIILRDPCAALRLAAAARFERVTHRTSLNSSHDAAPSAYRRSRLVQLLGILDALADGASPRDLAFSLVFPRQSALVGATWKGSGERRHTLRLVADARRMVDSGYRNLLCHE